MNISPWKPSLLFSVLVAAGCGLDSARDTNHVTANAASTQVITGPKPPSTAPVLKASNGKVWSIAGDEALLRGATVVNTNDEPATVTAAIAALASTGANAVNIEVNKNTSAQQLTTALDAAVANNLVAVVGYSMADAVSECTDSRSQLNHAVTNRWLGDWLPVLASAQYQSHLMINIAKGWGPENIFSASRSLSYRPYIDTYKTMILRFRDAGFKVPLIIDAPGCGRDFEAFLGGRDQELLAIDAEQNLILGVRAFGNAWSSQSRMLESFGALQRSNAPLLVTAFGDENAGDDAIDHNGLMAMAAGNRALPIAPSWVSDDDALTLTWPLDETIDGGGINVSLQMFLPQSYFDAEQSLSMQLVLIDNNGGYGLSEPRLVSTLIPNSWNRLIFAIEDSNQIAAKSAEFNLNNISEFGLKISANGKIANIVGELLVDNVLVQLEADPAFLADFSSGIDGWVVPQHILDAHPQIDNPLRVNNGYLEVEPTWAADHQNFMLNAFVPSQTANPLDFEESFRVSFDIFIPDEYATEVNLRLQPYLQDGSNFLFSGIGVIPFREPDFKFGQWQTVTVNIRNMGDYILNDGYAGNDNFDTSIPPSIAGLEIAGVENPKTEAIRFDNFKIVSTAGSKSGFNNAYTANFQFWQAGMGFGVVDPSALTVDAEGTLSVLPDWATATDTNTAILAGGFVDQSITINLRDPFKVTFDVFIPEEYNTEAGLAIQPFIFDNSYIFNSLGYLVAGASIPFGEWHTIELAFQNYAEDGPAPFDANFNYDLLPQGVGLQILNVAEGKTEGIQFRNYTVDQYFEVDATVASKSFDETTDLTAITVASNEALTTASMAMFTVDTEITAYSVKPFGWFADWWKSSADNAAWYDLSVNYGFTVEGDSTSGVNLTNRGEEVINGIYGIRETATPIISSP